MMQERERGEREVWRMKDAVREVYASDMRRCETKSLRVG